MKELYGIWLGLKNTETIAKNARLEIEAQIFEKLQLDKDKIKSHQDGGYLAKFSYNEKRTWDQDYIKKFSDRKDFPFNATYKEDKRTLNNIAQNNPKFYTELLNGLTTEPKKPTFSIGRIEE